MQEQLVTAHEAYEMMFGKPTSMSNPKIVRRLRNAGLNAFMFDKVKHGNGYLTRYRKSEVDRWVSTAQEKATIREEKAISRSPTARTLVAKIDGLVSRIDSLIGSLRRIVLMAAVPANHPRAEEILAYLATVEQIPSSTEDIYSALRTKSEKSSGKKTPTQRK